jgi:hypothetical protein
MCMVCQARNKRGMAVQPRHTAKLSWCLITEERNNGRTFTFRILHESHALRSLLGFWL